MGLIIPLFLLTIRKQRIRLLRRKKVKFLLKDTILLILRINLIWNLFLMIFLLNLMLFLGLNLTLSTTNNGPVLLTNQLMSQILFLNHKDKILAINSLILNLFLSLILNLNNGVSLMMTNNHFSINKYNCKY